MFTARGATDVNPADDPAGASTGARKFAEVLNACLLLLTWRILRFFDRHARAIHEPAPLSLEQARSILILRLDEIGDVLITSAFLRELRRCAPRAHIALVVKPGLKNLVERCPYVDRVATFDWSTRYPGRSLRVHGRALRFARQHLRPAGYDIAIVPRWDADFYEASFLAACADAPVRIGHSERNTARKRTLNRGFDRFFTLVLHSDEVQHEVLQNLRILKALGCKPQADHLELWLDDADRDFARRLFDQDELSDRRFVCIGPAGGRSPQVKQWPLEKFAELLDRIAEMEPCAFFLVGGPGEEELGRALSSLSPHPLVNLIGRTTLREMAAVMERCTIYIGNDSGPMHAAAAAGIPVVGLFAGKAFSRFAPWSARSKVVTPDPPSASHTPRIADITVGQVVDAVIELGWPPSHESEPPPQSSTGPGSFS